MVMENHDDDNSLDSFLQDPINRNAYVPYLPHLNFNRGNNRPNLGFPSAADVATAAQQTARLTAAGPNGAVARAASSVGSQIAVGSGSLGFVRHANGAVYLGSGSLGYNNEQQRISAVQEIRNRQSPAPSPLSFGHSPQN